MENGGQVRKKRLDVADCSSTRIKEKKNIAKIKRNHYSPPPTGNVTFRKKEKERARLALKIFREERRLQDHRREIFKLRRARAYDLAKEARTANNISNWVNAKTNSRTKRETKEVHDAEHFINSVRMDRTNCSQDLNLTERHAHGRTSSHVQSNKKRSSSCGQRKLSISSSTSRAANSPPPREGQQPNRDDQIQNGTEEERRFIHNVVASSSSIIDMENASERAQIASSTKTKLGGLLRVPKSSSVLASEPMTALRLSSKQLKQVTDNLTTAARNRSMIKSQNNTYQRVKTPAVDSTATCDESTTVRDYDGSNSKLVGYSSPLLPSSTSCSSSSSSLEESTDSFTQRNSKRMNAIWESLDKLKPRLEKLADQIPLVLGGNNNVTDFVIAAATPPENNIVMNSREIVVGECTTTTATSRTTESIEASSPHLNLNLNLNETENCCGNTITLPAGIIAVEEDQSLFCEEGGGGGVNEVVVVGQQQHHLPASSEEEGEEHPFVKPMSSSPPEVQQQYLPMAKEPDDGAKSQNSHGMMKTTMALEPISPLSLKSSPINDESDIEKHHNHHMMTTTPELGMASSIITAHNNNDNESGKKNYTTHPSAQVGVAEKVEFRAAQDQVEQDDDCFDKDNNKQMVVDNNTTRAAKQKSAQLDEMPHKNSSSVDAVEINQDPVSDGDSATSDENTNNKGGSFVMTDNDSFLSGDGHQHKSTSTPSYPNLHHGVRSPAAGVCTELEFTTPEARAYDAIPIGNVYSRFSSSPTLIEGCSKCHNNNRQFMRHQQFIHTAAAAKNHTTSQQKPCLCSNVASQELASNKPLWYEPCFQNGHHDFQLDVNLKLRSNDPTVICEAIQTCQQQFIPCLRQHRRKNSHHTVEEEGKDSLSVYRIFASAILQCRGQLKEKNKSDEREQLVGGCQGRRSNVNDELAIHMHKAQPLPPQDFEDTKADETSILNGGKAYINEITSNTVALDPEFEERNANLKDNTCIAPRTNANGEQEWKSSTELGAGISHPLNHFFQQGQEDDASADDIPATTASLRSHHCHGDEQTSRLTAKDLKTQFIAQLNVQNSIMENERKLTALIHARELNLAQLSAYQHWGGSSKRDAKMIIDEIANEERLKQQNEALKRELKFMKGEHEKQLKASEEKRRVTISLATEALTAANSTLARNISGQGRSCVPHLGDNQREQEELELLPSILRDCKFTAECTYNTHPENRSLNEKMGHGGVDLDFTNSLTDAAKVGAAKEESFFVPKATNRALPKTIENIVKICHSKEDEEEESDPNDSVLMECAAPLPVAIASWVCPKESCTQDDSSVDNDTFASESGIDSDARDPKLEVQVEREASAQAMLSVKAKPPGGNNSEIINVPLLNNKGQGIEDSFSSSHDRGVNDIAVRVERQQPLILAELTKEETSSLTISEKESISNYSDDTWE